MLKKRLSRVVNGSALVTILHISFHSLYIIINNLLYLLIKRTSGMKVIKVIIITLLLLLLLLLLLFKIMHDSYSI